MTPAGMCPGHMIAVGTRIPPSWPPIAFPPAKHLIPTFVLTETYRNSLRFVLSSSETFTTEDAVVASLHLAGDLVELLVVPAVVGREIDERVVRETEFVQLVKDAAAAPVHLLHLVPVRPVRTFA